MIILGINAYHGDSSACLLVDGKIVNAVDEERFTRVKHWAGFPKHAIDFCLKNNRLQASDIDYVAINSDPRANKVKKLVYTLRHFSPSFFISHFRNRQSRQNFSTDFSNAFLPLSNDKYIHVEHHRAHLASAFYPSGFNESALLSVDGFGDFSSAAWGFADANHLKVHQRVNFPHSLGIFYQAITQYLGFLNYGDEYKVMGMSAYGEPKYLKEISQLIDLHDNGFSLDLSYFNHHLGKANYRCVDGVPECDALFTPKLTQLIQELKPRSQKEPMTQVHYDIAASAQAVYEESLFHLLGIVYERTQCRNVSLSGGCALNSLANGKIIDRTPFKNVFVPAAAGDSGGAIGAAYEAYRMQGGDERLCATHKQFGAYLGPQFNQEDYRKAIDSVSLKNIDVKELSDFELFENVAELISQGKVVGWFDGAMEWGARALGNRSILADPRRPDMQSVLNVKIKLREGFRPFAPSILQEHVIDWFERDADVPYMTEVINIKKEKQHLIPAVTHVDGSGRLQTVTREANARYFDLITAFYNKTGVPMLINTSFNENEPIVCRPNEAINCFLRTKMDVLVLGNFVLLR